MFLHLSVSHSVHRGGVPASVHAGIHPLAGTSPSRYIPGRYTPLARYTPPCRYNPPQVHPLDRYTPGQVHPLVGTPPGQVHPLAGTPHRQVHPRAGTPPAGTSPQRTVRILLECFLVLSLNSANSVKTFRKNSNTTVQWSVRTVKLQSWDNKACWLIVITLVTILSPCEELTM